MYLVIVQNAVFGKFRNVQKVEKAETSVNQKGTTQTQVSTQPPGYCCQSLQPTGFSQNAPAAFTASRTAAFDGPEANGLANSSSGQSCTGVQNAGVWSEPPGDSPRVCQQPLPRCCPQWGRPLASPLHSRQLRLADG